MSSLSNNSGASSEPEETDTRYQNLGDDLGTALSEKFDYHGNFYFAKKLSDIYQDTYEALADPEITIERLGKIPLPLKTNKQADKIIQFARQAPFGKGEETVVDTKVRDTWEIDGSKITIGNAKWQENLETKALDEVCKGLGVDMTKTKPRMELYKLLLYTEGSHFAAHQDTKKAEGMFATLVVDLPAPHTGGDVVVSPSHSGKRQWISWNIFDTCGTCILAWYTDVVHEVEPITGGCRLVLSYNLVHTKPDVTTPTYQPPVPVTDDVKTARLREVLEGWDQGKYSQKVPSSPGEGDYKRPVPPFFAYVLDHDYSANDLASGASCLKGADDHKLSLLAPLAEEFNIKLGLANLKHEMQGPADDYNKYEELQSVRAWERKWEKESNRDEEQSGDDQASTDYDSDEEEEEKEEYTGSVTMIPGMYDDLIYTLSNFYTLDGKLLTDSAVDTGNDESRKSKRQKVNHNLNEVEFNYRHGVVIPEDAFKTERPDEEQYEKGYMGNECGDFTYWYYRAVVIMYHERDEAKTLSTLRDGF
ncbi:hypothetical protein BKA70DRAFT_1381122 [Coprinopsis sp. MPI-PUGE-AT-0042]|nr:hypothetical protein BKA70DRAFT_1381122 [Coprinopsis sp. MPI-PUGE-AT-0042]